MKALHLKLEKLHVMVDSDYGVNVLEKHSVAEKKWSAFLMIDAGDKRSQLYMSFQFNITLTIVSYLVL